MDTDHLATLDEKTFAMPESRVKNAGGIRARIAEMKEADGGPGGRSERRAKVQGVIDGNRPLNQQKLIETGRGDQTNLNLREGEGMADAAKTPYYSLVFRVSRFAKIILDYGEQEQRLGEWGDIMSQHFHTMLENWNGHDYNQQLCQWQMCVFGVGLAVFEDEVNPFWKSRKIADVLVPDETESDIELLDEAVVLRRVSPIDLYKWVKNKEKAKVRGWLPERVEKAIIKNASVDMRSKWGENWSETWQASLRRGDVVWNNKAFRIPLADYTVKEFSGKISHCIMLDDGTPSSKTATSSNESILKEDDEGLLFRKIGRFESYNQMIVPFFFDIGTGEWHSVKGLGPKIKDFCEVSNRLFSSMLDGAKNGSSLILEAQDGQATVETQLVHINGAVVIQPGYKVQQNRLADAMQGPITVRRELAGVLQSNTGQYTERTPGENFEPTLGQAQLNFQNRAQLGDAARDRYLKTLDKLYLEQVRRALNLGKKLYGRKPDSLNWYEKLALYFYENCIKDGVPEEALDFKYVCSVKATRGIGNGSPVSMEIAIQRLMSLLPMVSERGRNHILQMFAAFYAGQGDADSIVPRLGQGDIPGSNEWAASMEDNDLRDPNAVPPIVTPEQNAVTHFAIHFQDAINDVQALNAGQRDPKMVLLHLHNAGPHMRAHLNTMMGDPTRKGQLEGMEEAWQMLSKVADQLQQQVEEAAKAEQPQQPPQVDPELLKGLMKVKGELELRRAKAMGELQLKKEKQDATLRMKDIQVAHGMRLESAKAFSVPNELVPAA